MIKLKDFIAALNNEVSLARTTINHSHPNTRIIDIELLIPVSLVRTATGQMALRVENGKRKKMKHQLTIQAVSDQHRAAIVKLDNYFITLDEDISNEKKT